MDLQPAAPYRKATIFPFTWGKVIEVHVVGPYEVVEYAEYAEYASGTRQPGKKRDYSGRRLFHVYVDGEDTSRSTYTLEGALCWGMAFKQKQAQMAPALAALLKLDKELE